VALFKRLKLNEAYLRNNGWKELENRGTLMLGKTVGIIGVGRIGQNVAKRLGAWGMKVIGYDPYVKPETVASLGVRMVSFEELLQQSDLVTLHVVLTRETRGMLGMREFKMMKPTAFVVNTSRGQAIKEVELVQALNEKIITAAALDVFEQEPLPMNNPLRQVDPLRLLLTPHNIGANPGSAEAGQKMAAESMLAILDGKIPDTVVNPLAIPRWKERFWS
jgi:D-3-phosphoglycerate dehydrogenase / 2-oxoglutarate reductase